MVELKYNIDFENQIVTLVEPEIAEEFKTLTINEFIFGLFEICSKEYNEKPM